MSRVYYIEAGTEYFWRTVPPLTGTNVVKGWDYPYGGCTRIPLRFAETDVCQWLLVEELQQWSNLKRGKKLIINFPLLRPQEYFCFRLPTRLVGDGEEMFVAVKKSDVRVDE